MEQETLIIVCVFSATTAILLLLVAVLFYQVSSLRRRLDDLWAAGRLKVQKLTMENDKNHAFHNPAISPDEELARRGFSMYAGDDVESGRGSERQTGGEFVEELSRELDNRLQRQHDQQQPQPQQWQQEQQPQRPQQQPQQQHPPPFLLQSIQDNKRRSRSLANPVANGGRQSDTNPNFIY